MQILEYHNLIGFLSLNFRSEASRQSEWCKIRRDFRNVTSSCRRTFGRNHSPNPEAAERHISGYFVTL